MQLLICAIIAIVAIIDPNAIDPDSLRTSRYIITLLVLAWVNLAVHAKRWHDRNKSILWILFWFIPIIGQIWTLIELGFIRGTSGPNRFGPDPLGY